MVGVFVLNLNIYLNKKILNILTLLFIIYPPFLLLSISVNIYTNVMRYSGKSVM